MFGAIELVSDKSNNAPLNDVGSTGSLCRDMAIQNGLMMRAVYDRMIISPPLIITRLQIDELVGLARRALDLTFEKLKSTGQVKA